MPILNMTLTATQYDDLIGILKSSKHKRANDLLRTIRKSNEIIRGSVDYVENIDGMQIAAQRRV